MDEKGMSRKEKEVVPPDYPSLENDYRDSELGGHEDNRQQQSLYRHPPWARKHRTALIFHGLIICLYVVVGVSYFQDGPLRNRTCGTSSMLFTPIQDHVKHKITTIHDKPSDVKTSPYVGDTSPEVDAAWYRLLRHHNIRITDDELKALNQTSIPLSHGGGSMGMMAVFHEIHCLVSLNRAWRTRCINILLKKLVREAVFADHYYAGMSPTEKANIVGHTEHCIDILRSAAMCRADTAIFTYHWNDATRLPNPTWVQKHECLDWVLLEKWLDSRRIDIFSPNMLIHPKYGPAYPGGKRISEPDGPKVYPLDP